MVIETDTTNLRLRALPSWIRKALNLYAAKHGLAGVEAAIYHILGQNRELQELWDLIGIKKVVANGKKD